MHVQGWLYTIIHLSLSLSLSLCLHRLRLVTRSSSALVNYTPMPCRIFPTVKTVRSIAMTRYKQALLRMLAVLGCRCQFGADTPSNWIPKFLSCSVWVPRALSPDLPLEPQRPCLGRSHCSPQKKVRYCSILQPACQVIQFIFRIDVSILCLTFFPFGLAIGR